MTNTTTRRSTVVSMGERSRRKREAILYVAADLFLKNGYLGTSMDEVAERAEVSKQTVYKQFSNKEALFIAIVNSMTSEASGRVRDEVKLIGESESPAAYLLAFAERQLEIVLTPQLMRLRRLVIAEAGRFPELGAALYAGGPGRAIETLTSAFEHFADHGLIAVDDPSVAASQFNWLVMGDPVNAVMLLGDKAIPKRQALRRHAVNAVRMFLAAYTPPDREP